MNLQPAKWTSEHHSKLREKQLYRQLLNNASQCLAFSEEIINDRGAEAISYRKLDFSWLFHATGPLTTHIRQRKMHMNKELHCNIHPLTKEVSVQAPAVSTKESFQIPSNHSFKRTGQTRVLNEAAMRDWQWFVSHKISKQCKNKTDPLLPLRRQHSRPGFADTQNCINRTVTPATVKHIEIPQATRLQDILNPHVGSYVNHKENIFKKKIFASHLHVSLAGTCGAVSGAQTDPGTLTDNNVKLDPKPSDIIRQDLKISKQQLHDKPMTKLLNLRYAVDNWRSAWNINLPRQSVTVKGLKMALSDLHYPVRLEAITTCASRAVSAHQAEPEAGKATHHGKGCKVQFVPQEIQSLILSALDDPVKRVRIAAAVCQYAMRTPNSRARDILQDTIKQDPSLTDPDSWVAAQCLATDSDTSQAVIQRLLSQYFLSNSVSDQKQSMTLLSSMSDNTTLVRSLLAEELNSANWRTRVKACNCIAHLRIPINKDICNKLIHLLWNDWSRTVRQAAAQTLSKLDLSRDINNVLSVKLEEGPTSWRVEALVLIGQLNLMTPKLLPTFLRCFNDDFVAVRKQACLTAASLMMEEQMVLNQLINLMQNDPSWEVKIAAIDGCMTPGLQGFLMWALHHDKEPRVRIAACEALSALETHGPAFQHLLQERYSLEPNNEVQRHIEGLLKKHGYSLEGYKDTFNKIKLQVKQLCTTHDITQKLLQLEDTEKHKQQLKNYCTDSSVL